MQEDQLIEISAGELAQVSGGRSTRPQGLFGFFDGLYKSGVFHFASKIGGNKLADKMYGRRVTAADRTRAQAAMKQFLVAGGKLPKGVPNLFG